YKKVGMDLTQSSVLSGFGFLHDGSVASLSEFLSSPAFEFQGEQGLANMIAFMMAFSGSDLPNGNVNNPLFPPGTESQDTHAGVGVQVTVTDFANASAEETALVASMQSEADLNRVGIVAHGTIGQLPRGAAYVPGASFQLDRASQQISWDDLLNQATAADPMTLTVVPFGSQTRMGIDRDLDGAFDRDELDFGSDPANPNSVPDLGQNYCGPAVANSTGLSGVMAAAGSPVASENDLTLWATQLPTMSVGFFVASQTQGFVQGPGGSQGNLCISGDVARFSLLVQSTGQTGAINAAIDLENVPTNPNQPVLAGQTWNFQAWFRDSSGGQATSNFTDGLTVNFQ
ncbi:MAG: hypothetical protein AAGG01_15960, partial [Planctomycetota bacterium]